MARNNVVPLAKVETLHRQRNGAVQLADSAVESMVNAIKSLIDTGNLGVGDPLPSERELCEMFASSRNTVREAMRILKTYGVVDVRPKVGAVIIDRRMDAMFDLYSFSSLELSRQTFLDTQGLRQLIEVGSIDTLLAKLAHDDLVALRALNDAMYAAESIERAALHDLRFHTRIVAILDNRQINEMYRIMRPVMLKIMENGVTRRKTSEDGVDDKGHGEANYNEHTAIIDALEARNRLAYKFRMTTHLEAGLALIRDTPGGGGN